MHSQLGSSYNGGDTNRSTNATVYILPDPYRLKNRKGWTDVSTVSVWTSASGRRCYFPRVESNCCSGWRVEAWYMWFSPDSRLSFSLKLITVIWTSYVACMTWQQNFSDNRKALAINFRNRHCRSQHPSGRMKNSRLLGEKMFLNLKFI